jgi:hypothetical protein
VRHAVRREDDDVRVAGIGEHLTDRPIDGAICALHRVADCVGGRGVVRRV